MWSFGTEIGTVELICTKAQIERNAVGVDTCDGDPWSSGDSTTTEVDLTQSMLIMPLPEFAEIEAT